MLNTFARYVTISAVLLTCAACATPREPVIRTVEVLTPIREACVPADLAKPPETYADANAADLSPDERYKAIAQANQERRARLARVEPVLESCR